MRKLIILISVILLPVAAFAQDTTLTVTSDGKIGIGTSMPQATLDVDGAFTFTAEGTNDGRFLMFDNGAFTTEYIMRDEAVSGGTRQEFFRYNYVTGNLALDPASNVGIGTTNPLAKLHVSGVGMTIDSFIHGADQNESGGYWMKEKRPLLLM